MPLAACRMPFERLAVFCLAVFVFVHIAFLELLVAPDVFRISPVMRSFLVVLPYKTLLGVSLCVIVFAFCWDRFTFLSVLGICGMVAMAVIVVARLTGGASPSTAPAFLIFLVAAPFLYRNGGTLLRAVAWAVIFNAVYAIVQLLYIGGVVSLRLLPVIPLAFGPGEFLLTRPSGFYFQPTASGAIFGFATLIFRAAGKIYHSPFFKVAFGFSLVALLLAQAWAATLVFLVFYAFIFLGRVEAALAAVVVSVLTALGAVREYLSSEVYFKINVSLAAKIELIGTVSRYLASNPIVLFFGESLVRTQSRLNQENSFLDLILQYGLVLVVIIYGLILQIILLTNSLVRRLPLDRSARQQLRRIAFVPLYPLVLVFTQNSAFMPEVALLFCLSLAVFWCYISQFSTWSRTATSPERVSEKLRA